METKIEYIRRSKFRIFIKIVWEIPFKNLSVISFFLIQNAWFTSRESAIWEHLITGISHEHVGACEVQWLLVNARVFLDLGFVDKSLNNLRCVTNIMTYPSCLWPWRTRFAFDTEVDERTNCTTQHILKKVKNLGFKLLTYHLIFYFSFSSWDDFLFAGF